MKRLTTHPRRQARRERAALRTAAATLANLLGNGPVTRAEARGYTHIPRSERLAPVPGFTSPGAQLLQSVTKDLPAIEAVE